MSAVSAAGSALNASRSTRSMSAPSPNVRERVLERRERLGDRASRCRGTARGRRRLRPRRRARPAAPATRRAERAQARRARRGRRSDPTRGDRRPAQRALGVVHAVIDVVPRGVDRPVREGLRRGLGVVAAPVERLGAEERARVEQQRRSRARAGERDRRDRRRARQPVVDERLAELGEARPSAWPPSRRWDRSRRERPRRSCERSPCRGPRARARRRRAELRTGARAPC